MWISVATYLKPTAAGYENSSSIYMPWKIATTNDVPGSGGSYWTVGDNPTTTNFVKLLYEIHTGTAQPLPIPVQKDTSATDSQETISNSNHDEKLVDSLDISSFESNDKIEANTFLLLQLV